MKPPVHILATCRNKELFPATKLVLDTIRVGFPTAEIYLEGNVLDDEACYEIHDACVRSQVVWKNNYGGLTHWGWIQELMQIYSAAERPFFICDTDVIFWENFERFSFDGAALAGRFIPQFYEEYTGTITHARLHTCLMYIDPVKVAEGVKQFFGQLNEGSPFWIKPDLIEPLTYPLNGDAYYHDTMSKLYHAIGGEKFSVEQLNAFDHLNCGTYSDLVGARLTIGKNIRETQEKIMANPELARGCWKNQDAYFKHFER